MVQFLMRVTWRTSHPEDALFQSPMSMRLRSLLLSAMIMMSTNNSPCTHLVSLDTMPLVSASVITLSKWVFSQFLSVLLAKIKVSFARLRLIVPLHLYGWLTRKCASKKSPLRTVQLPPELAANLKNRNGTSEPTTGAHQVSLGFRWVAVTVSKPLTLTVNNWLLLTKTVLDQVPKMIWSTKPRRLLEKAHTSKTTSLFNHQTCPSCPRTMLTWCTTQVTLPLTDLTCSLVKENRLACTEV